MLRRNPQRKGMIKREVWGGEAARKVARGHSTTGVREPKGTRAGIPPWHLCLPSPSVGRALLQL